MNSRMSDESKVDSFESELFQAIEEIKKTNDYFQNLWDQSDKIVELDDYKKLVMEQPIKTITAIIALINKIYDKIPKRQTPANNHPSLKAEAEFYTYSAIFFRYVLRFYLSGQRCMMNLTQLSSDQIKELSNYKEIILKSIAKAKQYYTDLILPRDKLANLIDAQSAKLSNIVRTLQKLIADPTYKIKMDRKLKSNTRGIIAAKTKATSLNKKGRKKRKAGAIDNPAKKQKISNLSFHSNFQTINQNPFSHSDSSNSSQRSFEPGGISSAPGEIPSAPQFQSSPISMPHLVQPLAQIPSLPISIPLLLQPLTQIPSLPISMPLLVQPSTQIHSLPFSPSPGQTFPQIQLLSDILLSPQTELQSYSQTLPKMQDQEMSPTQPLSAPIEMTPKIKKVKPKKRKIRDADDDVPTSNKKIKIESEDESNNTSMKSKPRRKLTNMGFRCFEYTRITNDNILVFVCESKQASIKNKRIQHPVKRDVLEVYNRIKKLSPEDCFTAVTVSKNIIIACRRKDVSPDNGYLLLSTPEQRSDLGNASKEIVNHYNRIVKLKSKLDKVSKLNDADEKRFISLLLNEAKIASRNRAVAAGHKYIPNNDSSEVRLKRQQLKKSVTLKQEEKPEISENDLDIPSLEKIPSLEFSESVKDQGKLSSKSPFGFFSSKPKQFSSNSDNSSRFEFTNSSELPISMETTDTLPIKTELKEDSQDSDILNRYLSRVEIENFVDEIRGKKRTDYACAKYTAAVIDMLINNKKPEYKIDTKRGTYEDSCIEWKNQTVNVKIEGQIGKIKKPAYITDISGKLFKNVVLESLYEDDQGRIHVDKPPVNIISDNANASSNLRIPPTAIHNLEKELKDRVQHLKRFAEVGTIALFVNDDKIHEKDVDDRFELHFIAYRVDETGAVLIDCQQDKGMQVFSDITKAYDFSDAPIPGKLCYRKEVFIIPHRVIRIDLGPSIPENRLVNAQYFKS